MTPAGDLPKDALPAESHPTMASKKRIADFDEQLWPINCAIVILGGLLAGFIMAKSSPADPRLIGNRWVGLASVGLLMIVLLAGVRWLRGKMRRRLQLGIVVSLLVHTTALLLLAYGGVAQPGRSVSARQLGVPDEQSLPERFRSQDLDTAAEETPIYQQPVETEAVENPGPTIVEYPQPARETPVAEKEPAEPEPAGGRPLGGASHCPGGVVGAQGGRTGGWRPTQPAAFGAAAARRADSPAGDQGRRPGGRGGGPCPGSRGPATRDGPCDAPATPVLRSRNRNRFARPCNLPGWKLSPRRGTTAGPAAAGPRTCPRRRIPLQRGGCLRSGQRRRTAAGSGVAAGADNGRSAVQPPLCLRPPRRSSKTRRAIPSARPAATAGAAEAGLGRVRLRHCQRPARAWLQSPLRETWPTWAWPAVDRRLRDPQTPPPSARRSIRRRKATGRHRADRPARQSGLEAAPGANSARRQWRLRSWPHSIRQRACPAISKARRVSQGAAVAGPLATAPGIVAGPQRLRQGGGGGSAPIVAAPGDGPLGKSDSSGLLRGLGEAVQSQSVAGAGAGPGTGAPQPGAGQDLAVGSGVGEPGRQGGGLPVLMAAPRGSGGPDYDPTPAVGVPGRFARPQGTAVSMLSPRSLSEPGGGGLARHSGGPAIDGTVSEATEGYRNRAGGNRRKGLKTGGGEGTEIAVERGLDFFARLQFPDGHWSLHELPPGVKLDDAALGQMQSDTAATGLVLLAISRRRLHAPGR